MQARTTAAAVRKPHQREASRPRGARACEHVGLVSVIAESVHSLASSEALTYRPARWIATRPEPQRALFADLRCFGRSITSENLGSLRTAPLRPSMARS